MEEGEERFGWRKRDKSGARAKKGYHLRCWGEQAQRARSDSDWIRIKGKKVNSREEPKNEWIQQ